VRQLVAVAAFTLLCGLAIAATAVDVGSLGTRKFDWTEQRLATKSLVIGETTWRAVTQWALGPSYNISGDGGDPVHLCYLQREADGVDIRIVLSFFGSFEGGVLAAVEWQVLLPPVDSWIARVCRPPSLGIVGAGLDSGVKVGDSRRMTRLILGIPTKTSRRRDDYVHVAQRGSVVRSTQLSLTFDARDSLVGLDVRRIETN
jgi:hypothetical protein